MHNNCFAWLCFRQILFHMLMLANLFSWWKLDKICYLLQTAAFLCCSKVSFVFVCVCVFYLILFKRQKYSKNWYTVCKSICFKYAIRHYLKYLETKSFCLWLRLHESGYIWKQSFRFNTLSVHINGFQKFLIHTEMSENVKFALLRMCKIS